MLNLMQKKVITGVLLLLSLTALGCQSASLDTGSTVSIGCWNQFCEIDWPAGKFKIMCLRPSMDCIAVDGNWRYTPSASDVLKCEKANYTPPPDLYCSYSALGFDSNSGWDQKFMFEQDILFHEW